MKRLFAILLALCTIFALSACGKTVTTNAPTTQPPTLAPDATTRPPVSEEETTVPTETTTLFGETIAETTTALTESTSTSPTAAGETTTEAPATTTKAGVSAPKGTAAIVQFYNAAANNTKAQKNFSITRHNVLDCHITEGALSVIDGVLKDLREDTTIQEKFSNGKGTSDASRTPQSELPVENKPYMSKLEAVWVQSASCTQNKDGSFYLKLALKEESFLAKSEDAVHHHSCMDTLNVDWGGLPVKVEDSTIARTHDATITATVTADGKLLTELHIYEPVEVKGRVQVLAWSKLIVEGFWKQDIMFAY